MYWREHEREFPVLSRLLARDLLSVLALALEWKSFLNSARDMCYYRRKSLHEATIPDLMVYMCSEKFTLQGQQLSRIEMLMESETQEALEEDEALKANEEDAAPISDDEEAEEIEAVEGSVEAEATYQEETMLSEIDRLSTHNQTWDVKVEEERDGRRGR